MNAEKILFGTLMILAVAAGIPICAYSSFERIDGDLGFFPWALWYGPSALALVLGAYVAHDRARRGEVELTSQKRISWSLFALGLVSFPLVLFLGYLLGAIESDWRNALIWIMAIGGFFCILLAPFIPDLRPVKKLGLLVCGVLAYLAFAALVIFILMLILSAAGGLDGTHF